MKLASRSSQPILNGEKLHFFYSILTLWESNEENKVVKNFNSSELKRLLNRIDSHGFKILFFSSDINKKNINCIYEIYIKDSKRNYGMSLLYHLRNAFAHNDIQLINNGNIIYIQHSWNGVLKLKMKISYKVLKELIETIRGKHNLTSEEKQRKQKTKKTK